MWTRLTAFRNGGCLFPSHFPNLGSIPKASKSACPLIFLCVIFPPQIGGLVHRRKAFLNGISGASGPWLARLGAHDGAQCERVHMRQNVASLRRRPSPFLPCLLLVHLSYPRNAPLFLNFRALRSHFRVGALWYVSLSRRLIAPPTDLAFAFLLSGLYCSLFAGCVKVLDNKRRRSQGGSHRLILVSTTLFVLITWVCFTHV